MRVLRNPLAFEIGAICREIELSIASIWLFMRDKQEQHYVTARRIMCFSPEEKAYASIRNGMLTANTPSRPLVTDSRLCWRLEFLLKGHIGEHTSWGVG